MTVGPDAGYVRCVVEMGEAAARWLSEHGRDGVRFSLPPQRLMVVVPLSHPLALVLLADNKPSRKLLLAMDRAADGKGTLMQATFVLREMGLPFEEWSQEKLANLMKAVSKGGVS